MVLRYCSHTESVQREVILTEESTAICYFKTGPGTNHHCGNRSSATGGAGVTAPANLLRGYRANCSTSPSFRFLGRKTGKQLLPS